MIKCPKCDADNQIGAIFCRGCGEKLELDDLKPDTVREAAKSATGTKFNWFLWIKNAIMLGILAAVVGIFFGLFMKPGTLSESMHSESDMKTANSKLNAYYRGKKVSFTESEVNALIEDWFGLTDKQLEDFLKEKEESGEQGMIPRSIQVECLGEGELRLTMFQQHNGKEFIKYYSVLEGTLTASETGLAFEPNGYAQGLIPFHFAPFLKEKIETRFLEQYPAIQPFTEFIASVRNVTVNEGELVVKGVAKAGRLPVANPGGRRRRR